MPVDDVSLIRIWRETELGQYGRLVKIHLKGLEHLCPGGESKAMMVRSHVSIGSLDYQLDSTNYRSERLSFLKYELS